MDATLPALLPFLCIGLVVAASLHDIAFRTIPNGPVLGLAILGAAAASLEGRLIASLAVAALVFVLSVLCWRRGWMGGGDVKLLAAAALVPPPASVPLFVASVAIAGGILALLYLAGRRLLPARCSPRPAGRLARVLRAERWRIGRGGPLPYACAIAGGFLFVLS